MTTGTASWRARAFWSTDTSEMSWRPRMPATWARVVWLVRVRLVVLTVAGSIASEKVALGLTDAATPVVPLSGAVVVTVGGVVSGGGPPQVSWASAQSPWS